MKLKLGMLLLSILFLTGCSKFEDLFGPRHQHQYREWSKVKDTKIENLLHRACVRCSKEETKIESEKGEIKP